MATGPKQGTSATLKPWSKPCGGANWLREARRLVRCGDAGAWLATGVARHDVNGDVNGAVGVREGGKDGAGADK